MTNLGSYGFYIADGIVHRLGGAKMLSTGIRAEREWITGADGRPILADSLNINEASGAIDALRKVFPNASFNLWTGEQVLKSNTPIIGGLAFTVAGWYVVASSRANPDGDKVAFHPLGARLLGWLDEKKITAPGDGGGLQSLQKQVQDLGNGLLAELA